MSKADKKQRHKVKREAKRHAIRRRASLGPIKQLAGAGGDIECWMSDNFQSLGQAQIFVYKRAAGLSAVACFLVDRGVVGLKDAWTKAHVDRAEFNEMLEVSDRRGISMHRATVDDARQRVAGGIRWAFENGMRLPKDWVKTASVIGGVGDWRSADTSEFAKEFSGHPDDLRQRLIGEPFDSYLERDDVTFNFSNIAPYLNQRTGEYVEPDALDDNDIEFSTDQIPDEELQPLLKSLIQGATILAENTAKWLSASRELPSLELFEAWRSLMLASLVSQVSMPDATNEDIADFASQLLEGMDGRLEDSRFSEYQRGIGQALKHLETDSMMMKNAMLQSESITEASNARHD